jgi:hypothetical protein
MARVLRNQYGLVVTYCYTLLSIAETNARQQHLRWNDIRLNPRAAVIVTQQDMTALSDGNEPLAGRCNIEKQGAGRQTRVFGEIPRADG